MFLLLGTLRRFRLESTCKTAENAFVIIIHCLELLPFCMYMCVFQICLGRRTILYLYLKTSICYGKEIAAHILKKEGCIVSEQFGCYCNVRPHTYHYIYSRIQYSVFTLLLIRNYYILCGNGRSSQKICALVHTRCKSSIPLLY